MAGGRAGGGGREGGRGRGALVGDEGLDARVEGAVAQRVDERLGPRLVLDSLLPLLVPGVPLQVLLGRIDDLFLALRELAHRAAVLRPLRHRRRRRRRGGALALRLGGGGLALPRLLVLRRRLLLLGLRRGRRLLVIVVGAVLLLGVPLRLVVVGVAAAPLAARLLRLLRREAFDSERAFTAAPRDGRPPLGGSKSSSSSSAAPSSASSSDSSSSSSSSDGSRATRLPVAFADGCGAFAFAVAGFFAAGASRRGDATRFDEPAPRDVDAFGAFFGAASKSSSSSIAPSSSDSSSSSSSSSSEGGGAFAFAATALRHRRRFLPAAPPRARRRRRERDLHLARVEVLAVAVVVLSVPDRLVAVVVGGQPPRHRRADACGDAHARARTRGPRSATSSSDVHLLRLLLRELVVLASHTTRRCPARAAARTSSSRRVELITSIAFSSRQHVHLAALRRDRRGTPRYHLSSAGYRYSTRIADAVGAASRRARTSASTPPPSVGSAPPPPWRRLRRAAAFGDAFGLARRRWFDRRRRRRRRLRLQRPAGRGRRRRVLGRGFRRTSAEGGYRARVRRLRRRGLKEGAN